MNVYHLEILDFHFSEGGFFKAHLEFTKEYPQKPPVMRFISDIWHPNSKLFIIYFVYDSIISQLVSWLINPVSRNSEV